MNRIKANTYAPKCAELAEAENSHGVFYGGCNFKCAFCGMANKGDRGGDISEKLIELTKSGLNFKFTGGEPTLDRRLPDHLRLVRSLGGRIFLDTNGSNPEALGKLLDENLVDVLGISVKGVTPEEAERISGRPRRLSWENVMKSVRLGLSSNARTIVTLIVYGDSDAEKRLEEFYGLFRDSERVYYKINSLFKTRRALASGLTKMDEERLWEEIQKWTERHEDIRGRVIFVPNERAVHEFGEIRFC
ncbi:MAG: radical SAM protein [Oscillospiraceae bacterium]|nr:radical SAM protein [Oscillospiraceae bacterium]